ncbi:unnamed protein product [Chrysoparadoxa australica]
MGQKLSAASLERSFPNLWLEACAVSLPRDGKRLKYGTAGFRMEHSLLNSTAIRMGMLAALRSAKTGMAVGVMITASHNQAKDNGMKMVDASGSMLARNWEAYAETLANAPCDKVSQVLADVCGKEGVPIKEVGCWGGGGEGSEAGSVRRMVQVFVGRDTRESGPRLLELVVRGIKALGGTTVDLGVVTTPQLHHCVRMHNAERASGEFWGRPEFVGVDGYFVMLSEAFAGLLSLLSHADRAKSHVFNPFPTVVISQVLLDAAFGVGGPHFERLAKAVADRGVRGGFHCEIRNMPGNGPLNQGCGAEYAQKRVLPPAGFSKKHDKGLRCCSLDGDADRLVYHYFKSDGNWSLLDGDKIACLVASFLSNEMRSTGMSEQLSMGVVQTAYANGASTAYLQRQGVQTVVAKTGVKFVHHAAEQFDVGIYFEANGHGTVLFKPSILLALKSVLGGEGDPRAKGLASDKQLAARRLLFSHQLINQAVGDGLSCLLMVEAVLRLKEWKVEDWDALYSDLPSRQCKVRVQDREVITCSDDETRVKAPAALQAALDEAMKTVDQGRCFARPSGTEDVVRVYAEASSQRWADSLALLTMQAIHDHAGGVGPRPASLSHT